MIVLLSRLVEVDSKTHSTYIALSLSLNDELVDWIG